MTSTLLVFMLILATLLILLMMYVYLVWRKAFNQRRKNKKAGWINKQFHHIETYLATGLGADHFTPKNDYEFEALEDYFSDFLSNFKLEMGVDPITSYVEEYFVPRYRKKLTDKRWSVRMNTLYFIDLFKIKSMQDDLIRHLSSKHCSPEERYEILILLAAFEYSGLMELLKQTDEIPSFLLTELMAQLIDQDNLDPFLESFHSFTGSWQWAILDVVRDKNLRSEQLQQFLEQLISSEDRELRVRALKTIASLGYISSPEIVIQLIEKGMNTGQWDTPQANGEKLMVTRLMGTIRHEPFIPFLMQLVADRVYGIRSEAAKALRQYKGGKEILLSIASTHPDRYARSISQEWIERSLDYE